MNDFHKPTKGGKYGSSQGLLPGSARRTQRKPFPSLEGTGIVIKYVAEQNPKAAAIKVDDLIDTNWLKKLDGEGFFEKVYGGKY